MARTADPHAATLKAWETRARAGSGSGTATQSRGDFAKPPQGETEWADGITQARDDGDEPYGRVHDEWAALSKADQSALDGYMGDYEVINSHLRSGAGVGVDDRTIRDIDDAFRNASVSGSGETVYRGLTDALSDLKPGDIIEDKGFVSTTLSPEVARGYSKPGGSMPPPPSLGEDLPTSPDYNYRTGHTRAVDAWRAAREVITRIKIPKGASYLPGDVESAELVLNRGSRFRVLRTGKDSEGRRVYDMELIP